MRGVKKAKTAPVFTSEEEERAFWETHDTTEYVDWSRAKPAAFPDLRLSTETISLRLPAGLLAELKVLANKRDVPYQSLMKVFLADRVARERTMNASRTATPGVSLASARSSEALILSRNREGAVARTKAGHHTSVQPTRQKPMRRRAPESSD